MMQTSRFSGLFTQRLQQMAANRQQVSILQLARMQFGGAASGPGAFFADLAKEEPNYKISPAAGWWMRSYGVLPS